MNEDSSRVLFDLNQKYIRNILNIKIIINYVFNIIWLLYNTSIFEVYFLSLCNLCYLNIRKSICEMLGGLARLRLQNIEFINLFEFFLECFISLSVTFVNLKYRYLF